MATIKDIANAAGDRLQRYRMLLIIHDFVST